MIKPINVTIPERYWPLRKIAAITLWPFIVWREGYRKPSLEAHEMYHWRQAGKYFVLPWYALYLVLLVVYRTGGRNHPMERRAYEIEDAARCCCYGNPKATFKFCPVSFANPHCEVCGNDCPKHLQ